MIWKRQLAQGAGIPVPISGGSPGGVRAVGRTSTAGVRSRRLDAPESHGGRQYPGFHPSRAADSVLNHSAKAIEIEDIEVRVAALEAATRESGARR